MEEVERELSRMMIIDSVKRLSSIFIHGRSTHLQTKDRAMLLLFEGKIIEEDYCQA